MLLYEMEDPGSIIDRYNTQNVCEQLGIDYYDTGCKSIDEVIAVLKESAGIIDAFIFGNQALFFVDEKMFVEAAGMTPIFSYSERIVKYGALAVCRVDKPS